MIEPTNRKVQALLVVGAILTTCGTYWLGYADVERLWREHARTLLNALLPPLDLGDDHAHPVLLGLLFAVLNGYAAHFYRPSIVVEAPFQIIAVVAGAVCGFASGFAIGMVVAFFAPDGRVPLGLPAYLTVVPPVLVVCVALGEILFVGAISKWSTDFDREWWARAGAWTAILVTSWLGLFGIALFAPYVLDSLIGMEFGGSVYALILAAAGILARLLMQNDGPSHQDTHPGARSPWRERGFDVAAAVALFAILAGIAWLVANGLSWLHAAAARARFQVTSAQLPFTVTDVFVMLFVLAAIAGLAGVGVNVNRFSLHAMYRDRLIRTFLGATRAKYATPAWPLDEKHREPQQFERRDADRFIQFDRDDNPIFRWLDPQHRKDGGKSSLKPLLLINAALNLVAGRNLAWQERKASSFTFSALHVGNAQLGYRSSAEYAGDVGGITLGTEMAVSGAAISPNAGSHSSPIRTFLLTLFNARLGWWLGHPKDERTVRLAGPTFAVGALRFARGAHCTGMLGSDRTEHLRDAENLRRVRRRCVR